MSTFPLGNPAAVEAFATRFDRRAEDLMVIGRRVRNGLQAGQWRCAKATRFRHELDARQQDTERIANEMRSIARDLRRIAAQVRAEYDLLNGLERRVRQIMGGYRPKPGSTPPWQGTRWSPGNLPRSGDPAWREVARALGVQ